MPVFPSGTIAVFNGLYLRILYVVPPFLFMFFFIAGIVWIKYGTGTESSLLLNDCCTGAGNMDEVVIGMMPP
jgi:hypothetical protein